MKKLILAALACTAILSLAGCGEGTSSQASTSTPSSVDSTSSQQGTTESLSPLESARREYNRTPDMTYYTYYIGTDEPESIDTW